MIATVNLKDPPLYWPVLLAVSRRGSCHCCSREAARTLIRVDRQVEVEHVGGVRKVHLHRVREVELGQILLHAQLRRRRLRLLLGRRLLVLLQRPDLRAPSPAERARLVPGCRASRRGVSVASRGPSRDEGAATTGIQSSKSAWANGPQSIECRNSAGGKVGRGRSMQSSGKAGHGVSSVSMAPAPSSAHLDHAV